MVDCIWESLELECVTILVCSAYYYICPSTQLRGLFFVVCNLSVIIFHVPKTISNKKHYGFELESTTQFFSYLLVDDIR